MPPRNKTLIVRPLFLLLGLGACAYRGPYRAGVPDDPTASFARFLDEVELARLDRDPELRSRAGLAPLLTWPDPTGQETVIDIALTLEERGRLEAFSPVSLGPEARRSHQLLVFETDRRLERLRWSGHRYLALPGECPIAYLVGRLLGSAGWKDTADAEAWIAQVQASGPWLDRMNEELEARQGRGLLAPGRALERVADEARTLLAGSPMEAGADQDGLLLEGARAGLAGLEGLEPGEEADLLLRCEGALAEDLGPALARWLARVEALAEESPGESGVWSLPDGEDWYDTLLRDATTLGISADQLHGLGLAEVERLHDELRRVMKQLGLEGSLAEFFQLLQKDLLAPEEGVDEAKTRLSLQAAAHREWLLGLLDQVLLSPPDHPAELQDLEEVDPTEVPRYRLLALVSMNTLGSSLREWSTREHAGLPGFRHTLKIATWAEGWDLYASALPLELGLTRDPYTVLGGLTEELWAAALLVVDTGLHHERWTPNQALDWLKANTPASEPQLKAAVFEVLLHPASAVARTAGCLQIRKLRRITEERLGMRFDLRRFHELILESGPITLSMLEARMRRWR